MNRKNRWNENGFRVDSLLNALVIVIGLAVLGVSAFVPGALDAGQAEQQAAAHVVAGYA